MQQKDAIHLFTESFFHTPRKKNFFLYGTIFALNFDSERKKEKMRERRFKGGYVWWRKKKFSSIKDTRNFAFHWHPFQHKGAEKYLSDPRAPYSCTHNQ